MKAKVDIGDVLPDLATCRIALALGAQVYADVSAGGRQAASTYASFADGHFEMRFCDAVLKSAVAGTWVDI